MLTGAELARLAGVAESPDPEAANRRWTAWREQTAAGIALPEYCHLALQASSKPEAERETLRDHSIRMALNSDDLVAAWDIALLLASES